MGGGSSIDVCCLNCYLSGVYGSLQDELKREIELEIQRLGRVALVDLSGTLGVELIHCERQAQQIVQNDASLSLVQGEILSSNYWDSIAEEINESLEVSGQMSVGELARRFSVGAELITNVLSARLGTSVSYLTPCARISVVPNNVLKYG